MSVRRPAAALCAVASLLAAPSCDSGDEDAPARNDSSAQRAGREQPVERDRSAGNASPPPVVPATCPPAAGNCRSASGVVLYVARVR